MTWQALLAHHWDQTWGDRRQELVFIGTGMDEAAIRTALEPCLVGPADAARFVAADYRHLPDLFPTWNRQAA